MSLGPAKPSDAPRHRVKAEVIGKKPRRSHATLQLLMRPAALLFVVGECGVVYREPLMLIAADNEATGFRCTIVKACCVLGG